MKEQSTQNDEAKLHATAFERASEMMRYNLDMHSQYRSELEKSFAKELMGCVLAIGAAYRQIANGMPIED